MYHILVNKPDTVGGNGPMNKFDEWWNSNKNRSSEPESSYNFAKAAWNAALELAIIAANEPYERCDVTDSIRELITNE